MSVTIVEKKSGTKKTHRVWRALIGGVVTIATTLIVTLDKNDLPDNSHCIETKKDAAACIREIDKWLLEPFDDQVKMNLVYWKEYCQSVLRYECPVINDNAAEITKNLYTAKRQIELCENL